MVASDRDTLPRDSSGIMPPIITYHTELRLHSIASSADLVIADFVNEFEDGPGEYWGLRGDPSGRIVTFSGRTTASSPVRLYQCDLGNRSVTTHEAQAPDAVLRQLHPGFGPVLVEEYSGIPIPYACDPYAFANCGCRSGTMEMPAHWVALRDTLAGTSAYVTYRQTVAYSSPRWSPDGTRVLYTRTENGNSDVCMIAITSNRAPAFSSSVQTYYSSNACIPLEIPLSAADPDGDAVTYEVLGLPDGAALQGNHHVYWPFPVVGDYWIVARALDPSGAVASKVIQLNLFDAGNCGGGGGEDPGEIMRRGPLARSTDAATRIGPGGAHAVNTFLDGAASGEWVTQTGRLAAPSTDAEGHVGTRLVGLRPGTLRTDRARLMVVDHSEGTVAVSVNGGVAVGTRKNAERITVMSGDDLTAQFGAAVNETRVFEAGSVVAIDLAKRDSVEGLIVECARAAPLDSLTEWGIRVDTQGANGWEVAGRLYPRTGHDVLALPIGGVSHARLVFLSDVSVRDLAGFSFAGVDTSDYTVATVPCTFASTETGAADLAEADTSAISLTQGQGVSLWFDGPVPIEGKRRSHFLELRASFTPEASSSQMAARSTGSSLPLVFALHANRPNPFGGSTVVRFDVPRTAQVRVEIFDAQGRRVRTLANRAFAPGSHSVQWDGADGSGRRVNPGVYLYRMTSDNFREQKRMVLLGK